MTELLLPKPSRGAARRARIVKRLKIEHREDTEKAKVRRRDPPCRWPHATAEERAVCRRTRKEVAHIFAKGMGGDPLGVRTSAALMVRACADVHQGPLSFHAQNRRVVFLTPAKASGPLAFEEKRGGRWMEVGREVHVGVLA